MARSKDGAGGRKSVSRGGGCTLFSLKYCMRNHCWEEWEDGGLETNYCVMGEEGGRGGHRYLGSMLLGISKGSCLHYINYDPYHDQVPRLHTPHNGQGILTVSLACVIEVKHERMFT